jgi:flagellar biogenesis protein FliO
MMDFFPFILTAQSDPSTQEIAKLPSVAGLFFRIIISLALILLLTYGILKLLKKQQTLEQRQKGWIEIYDYQALGMNRGIYLMQIFSRIYVVGVSEGQINILQEIEPDNTAWLELKESMMNPPKPLKGGLFRMKELWKTLGQGPGKDETNSFQRQLQEQIDRAHRLTREVKRGEHDE